MSDQKILFISLVVLISINVFVAPLISDEEGDTQLPDLTPPDSSILSEDFDPSVETEGGGITEAIANLIAQPIGYLVGFLVTAVWFILSIGSIIFSGSVSHPVILLMNFLITIVVIQTIFKTSDWL